MFVMISPLQAHLSETLTSLKFATKVCLLVNPPSLAGRGRRVVVLVQRNITNTFLSLLQVHNTHIGTAKRQARVSG